MSSIVSAIERYEGLTGSQKLEKYIREYNRKFRITCSDNNMDINTILTTSGSLPLPVGSLSSAVTLPVIGTDTYPSDSGSLCVGVSYTYSGNGTVDLSYQYSSNPPISQLRNKNPLDRLPIYKYSYQKFQTPMIFDLGGSPVINVNGQPFAAPPMIDSAYRVIDITQNYADYSSSLADSLEDSINDADWTPANSPDGATYPKYSCKMDSISASPKEEDGITYYEVTFRVLYNSDLWYPYTVLNCGYMQNVGGSLQQITDAYGNAIQTPALLDSAGVQTLTPYYLEFDAYEEASWSLP